MESSLLIAHFTDVHLGPITGISPRYWNLKRTTGYLNWLKNRRHVYARDVLDRLVADAWAQGAGHLIVTGDLVNLGLPAEHAAALKWLETVGPPDRVSVIPGNHDIYSRIGRDVGTGRWSAYMSSHDAGAEEPFPYVRRIGPVALIGVNSAIETRPLEARGRVGPQQRERLARMLARTEAEGLFRLVMIHHPPLVGAARRAHELIDAAEVTALFERFGADLVVHGHNHRDMLTLHGPAQLPIVGAASASHIGQHADEPLARYNLYRIRRAGRGFVLEMQSRGVRLRDGPIEQVSTRSFAGVPAI